MTPPAFAARPTLRTRPEWQSLAFQDPPSAVPGCGLRCPQTWEIHMTAFETSGHRTVYRGCYKDNKWGLSWTLSRELAKGFPMLWRYRQNGQQPLLVTARARKENVIALKTDRGESEVITWRPKHISTRHITAREPALELESIPQFNSLTLLQESRQTAKAGFWQLQRRFCWGNWPGTQKRRLNGPRECSIKK